MPYDLNYPNTIARWLPNDPAVIRKDQDSMLAHLIKKGVCTQTGDVDNQQLSRVILEFKELIEEDPEIFRDFHEMFKQVPSNQLSVSVKRGGQRPYSPH